MVTKATIQIDISCDVQQVDDTGFVWTFLDEAREQSLVRASAIVIADDEKSTLSSPASSISSQVVTGRLFASRSCPAITWSTPRRSLAPIS
jgi:hypothetical protein